VRDEGDRRGRAGAGIGGVGRVGRGDHDGIQEDAAVWGRGGEARHSRERGGKEEATEGKGRRKRGKGASKG
jgi:hypothetical protein